MSSTQNGPANQPSAGSGSKPKLKWLPATVLGTVLTVLLWGLLGYILTGVGEVIGQVLLLGFSTYLAVVGYGLYKARAHEKLQSQQGLTYDEAFTAFVWPANTAWRFITGLVGRQASDIPNPLQGGRFTKSQSLGLIYGAFGLGIVACVAAFLTAVSMILTLVGVAIALWAFGSVIALDAKCVRWVISSARAKKFNLQEGLTNADILEVILWPRAAAQADYTGLLGHVGGRIRRRDNI